ncbi:MAG: ABC transporter ATP-binding protein [Ignavibacteriaceae bacterium]|nr:ABC transporter ATP-binding protein [Ignavibacteriaceae bacterium]
MKNLFTLKKYFARYRNKLLAGLLFILFSNAGMVYIPILIKDSINTLQQNVHLDRLIDYALLIVGTSLISGIFRFYIRQTIIVVSREIEYDLRGDFWAHIQRLPMKFFQQNSTGNIMAHATNDMNAVRMFIGPAVMYSIDTFLRLVIVVSIMITISPSLTLYSLIPLPLLSVAVYFVGKKIHARFTAIQEKFSELTTKVQENFSGIRVIKSYAREEWEIKDFAGMSRDFLRKNMSLVKIQAFFQPMLFLLTGTSIVIVIWIGGLKVINGELLLGDVTALVIYLGILIWPMIAFGWVINIIQQGEASMKRLNKIFGEKYEITDDGNTDHSIKTAGGDIIFKNVTFRYGENLPVVLDNINLEIKEGAAVAIMGSTGCGKSTLVNLLPRLHDVSSGVITVGGKGIKSVPLSVLRTAIGYVPQETFLFSDTIKNNLCYGLRSADEERMLNASAIAMFDRDVVEFPEKYNTVVGERGITLSGGQKQRASIARALIKDPSILILDDSFSAVDTHTEEEILINLRGYMKGRTSIIISHRVSTVKECDKIIVLDKGKIAEEGTHEELLALGGLYCDIYTKQQLEKEIQEYS